MTIAFLTQNEAPFRLKWMDELSKYVTVYYFHVGEYVGIVDKKFISYSANSAIVEDVGKNVMGYKLYDIKSIFRRKYDLIILDGYGFLAQIHMIFYLKMHHIPYLMSIDGGFIKNSENFIKKCIKRFVISGAQAYLSTSKETDSFIRYYSYASVKIFRHYFSSIYSEQINLKIESKEYYRNRLGMKNIFSVIAVGKFIPIKGFDTLIQVAELFDQDLQIYFVGADNGDIYERYINERNKDKVHFISFCDSEHLKEYYMASDVLVMPSRGDVWGLVVGEAMAAGLPVISSDRCLAGIAMIEEGINGYIFKTGSVLDLFQKIKLLMDNKELGVKMGENNLKKIKKYAIDYAVKDDVRNFKELVKE